MWLSSGPVTIAGLTAPGYVLLTVATIMFVAIFRQIMLPRPINGIPYNAHSARRILGDLPDILRHPNRREWFVDQAKAHNAPLMQFFVSPFRGPTVFVFDHREAQNLAMRRVKDFDRSPWTRAVFSVAAPNQILCLASHQPQYKSNMNLIRELMTPTFLRQVSGPHIHEKITWLLQLWDEKAGFADGRPFDASADVHHAALDMIMGASFGIDKAQSMLQAKLDNLERTKDKIPEGTNKNGDDTVDFQDPPLLEELRACKTIADSIGIAIKSAVPSINAWVYRNLVPSMRGALAVFKKMSQREIAKSIERLHSGRVLRCAMDQLLAREEVLAKKEGRRPNYYSKTIKDELLGYLIGGHETTSSALQWGLKYITSDQRVQAKLRNVFYEQFPDARAEGRLPSVDEITDSRVRIPYLEACIQEIVRHAKPLSIMSRASVIDTTLLGVPIPRGTNVSFTSNGPGYCSPALPVDEEKRHESARTAKDKTGAHNPETVADFYPERWIRTAADGAEEFNQSAGPFLSFGDGPRMCFGKKLALLEMRIFWILVLWHFELRPVPLECETDEEAVYLARIPKHVYLRLGKIRYRGS